MAPHCSTLAWEIPWTEEPGGLQSMGSRRIRHNWVTSLSLFTFMHWRRKWQPTPVFLSGESQGRGSLVGCRLWGRTESDMMRLSSRSSSNVGDIWSLGLIPELGRSCEEGNGKPLQYFGLENSMDCMCPRESDTTEWLSLSLFTHQAYSKTCGLGSTFNMYLVVYSPWVHRDSDTTNWLITHAHILKLHRDKHCNLFHFLIFFFSFIEYLPLLGRF